MSDVDNYNFVQFPMSHLSIQGYCIEENYKVVVFPLPINLFATVCAAAHNSRPMHYVPQLAVKEVITACTTARSQRGQYSLCNIDQYTYFI